jgi:D-alanyl-D-alanine carboxypeptidase (penicillin-binding protein 5/6)
MERERRECASLTKIMTAFVVLNLMDRWTIEDKTLVKVGSDAASVIGTSAELQEGDTLTLWQLLYGLMLPSGNDSAHQLAEFFGTKLKKEAEERYEKEGKELEE